MFIVSCNCVTPTIYYLHMELRSQCTEILQFRDLYLRPACISAYMSKVLVYSWFMVVNNWLIHFYFCPV